MQNCYDPVIVVRTEGKELYLCHEVDILGPSTVVYRRQGVLGSVHVVVETNAEVKAYIRDEQDQPRRIV